MSFDPSGGFLKLGASGFVPGSGFSLASGFIPFHTRFSPEEHSWGASTSQIASFLPSSRVKQSVRMSVCTYVFAYVCVYVHMYVCMYVCMYESVGACMYACMHVCMHACMYVCAYVCVCRYVCQYVCTQVCMYVCMHVVCKSLLTCLVHKPPQNGFFSSTRYCTEKCKGYSFRC